MLLSVNTTLRETGNTTCEYLKIKPKFHCSQPIRLKIFLGKPNCTESLARFMNNTIFLSKVCFVTNLWACKMAVFTPHNSLLHLATTAIRVLTEEGFMSAGPARDGVPGSQNTIPERSGYRFTLLGPNGLWSSPLKAVKMHVSGWQNIRCPTVRTESTGLITRRIAVLRYWRNEAKYLKYFLESCNQCFEMSLDVK